MAKDKLMREYEFPKCGAYEAIVPAADTADKTQCCGEQMVFKGLKLIKKKEE